MISELRDEEILDFLMTSEFEGDYSPEELKYLLIKWRYFYRLINGRLERVLTDNEGDVRKLNSNIETLNNKVTNLLVENTNKDNLIDSMKGRKLTFKERLSGKIINKENEN
jgi:hypothetical protein